MILDNNELFSSAQAITSTAASTNVIDQGVARDLGPGQPLRVLCQAIAALTTTNSATLTVQLQGSSDNSTFSTYAESRAYAAAELVAGARLLDIDVPRPSGTAVLPRYFRMNYVVGTGVFSTGTITSGFLLGRDDQVYYPPGVAVAN